MAKKTDKISLPANSAGLPGGTKVPDQGEVIMDGNRRWARARGLDTLEGHRAGFDQAIKIGRAARDMGIHTVSLWGWSTENWDREKREIDYLMMLFGRMLQKYLKEAMEEKVRLVHLGRKDRLPADLINQIVDAETKTRNFTKHIVNICLDYGGRDDIARAVNKYSVAKEKGEETREMDEKVMMDYLDTQDQPYPYVDLLIRTSGEQRTSGFLLWQAAYAETYWELDHLPDFTPLKFAAAVIDYSRRRRRFGVNDKEEHFKFNPTVLAKLELDWRRQLDWGEGERLRDVAVKYMREVFGTSKDLAVESGVHLANALVHRREKDWQKAMSSMEQLAELVKQTLKLAFEPKLVAKFQVDLWRKGSEDAGSLGDSFKVLYAETFRISEFQAAKAANLKALAKLEMGKGRWAEAKWYLERFYMALKDRVA